MIPWKSGFPMVVLTLRSFEMRPLGFSLQVELTFYISRDLFFLLGTECKSEILSLQISQRQGGGNLFIFFFFFLFTPSSSRGSEQLMNREGQQDEDVGGFPGRSIGAAQEPETRNSLETADFSIDPLIFLLPIPFSYPMILS